MTDLIAGQNITLSTLPISVTIQTASADGFEVDTSAYVLGDDGKTRGDEDMIFYGQPVSPDGNVSISQAGTTCTITIKDLPAGADKIALAVVADDQHGKGRTLSAAGHLELKLQSGSVSTSFEPDLSSEKALIVGEIYRRNGDIKFRAIGQGFDGGLKPLSEHFGITVADEPANAPAPAPAAPVDLRKQRLVNLEKSDPELVSLAKTATISLEKKGVADQRAKVALCLDISASMDPHFRSKAVDRLVQRILALGLSMDDDGDIDIFLFGRDAHNYGSVDAGSYQGFVPAMQRTHRLEGATMYGLVMQEIRAHYSSQSDWGKMPIYVMFVTDGGTQDVRRSETQIMEASHEPIFWQFMAIGNMPPQRPGKTRRNQRVLPRGFDFLQHLDDMEGRAVDNANFFAVSNPDDPSNAELYDMLMEEYPDWLKQVRSKGILG